MSNYYLGDELGYDPFYGYMILLIVGLTIIIIYLLIIWYTNLPTYKPNDPLNKYWEKIPGVRSEYWLYSHLILFTIIGFLYPSGFLVMFLLGIFWEATEYAFGKFGKPICRYVNGEKTCINWFYTSFLDCLVNGLGLLLGIGLRNTLFATVD